MLNRIKALCAQKGVSLAEMERACNLPHRTTRNWERSAPNVYSVATVAKYLGVSVEELISPDGE